MLQKLISEIQLLKIFYFNEKGTNLFVIFHSRSVTDLNLKPGNNVEFNVEKLSKPAAKSEKNE